MSLTYAVNIIWIYSVRTYTYSVLFKVRIAFPIVVIILWLLKKCLTRQIDRRVIEDTIINYQINCQMRRNHLSSDLTFRVRARKGRDTLRVIHRIHCTPSVGTVPVNEQEQAKICRVLNAACETRDGRNIQSFSRRARWSSHLKLGRRGRGEGLFRTQKFARWRNTFSLLYYITTIAIFRPVLMCSLNFFAYTYKNGGYI